VQVIVPKRTALLLDRIMAVLQKAAEDDKGGPNLAPDLAENKVRSYVTVRHDMFPMIAMPVRSDSALYCKTFGELRCPQTDSLSVHRLREQPVHFVQ
jgi:hypothetical protein